MIDRAETSDRKLLELLAQHPRVGSVTEGGGGGARFWQGSWARSIAVGNPALQVAGLVELMDNNPLVCCDAASVPDAASTLALIALGPVAQAGLICEDPVFQCSLDADLSLLKAFLRTVSWGGGITADCALQNLGRVAAGTAIVSIPTPERPEDLDDLYEEAYGRSFYVRRDESSEWDTRLVRDQAHALYRLRITPGNDRSLLTIQVMADLDGKCGAAQVVHAVNVMCGFEETLGVQGEAMAGSRDV